ncbi:MAG: 16S rRNA (cytosine(1402)-N(4))-methyltransferase RsmH [Desulfomonile tiedjei]|nr:16S rRNA (cytosine(1402)-N(4))-methyltransferase RsmH [Desulfomonile tiedjei]
MVHVPVLLHEMLDAIRPRSGGVYLDGTLGAGGYAEAILLASEPDGRLVGLDLDPFAVERAREKLQWYGDRFRAVHGGFHEARGILGSLGIAALDGAVIDLGLSSDQLEAAARGFSFQRSGPLDMRFDPTSGEPLFEQLMKISTKKLEEILATYGEERYCKKLARGIVDALAQGKLKNTHDLAELVARVYGKKREKIHPATRTFQALRIAVNRELENLEIALRDIPLLLKKGGRFCVISYHSLEDRAVKLSFKEKVKDSERWSTFTLRPVRPRDEEIRANPRARSARMRVLMALQAQATEPSAEPVAGRDQ